MAKNEIAKAGTFNLMTISGDLAEAVAEEMDGLGMISFDRVKIPSSGGIAFELPGEDEDNPESSPAITGIILDHHAVNAYWRDAFSGGNAQPDCSSTDGKTGVWLDTGEVSACANCPHNQFGSEGRGKACKNMHRLYILQEGNPVPIILALPPTSLKSLRDYIGKKILLKGFRCYQVITKITLKKEKNADGIAYSRAVFAFQDKLTPEQQQQVEGMRELVKATRQQISVADDYAPGSAAPLSDDGFMDLPENNADEDLPFDN